MRCSAARASGFDLGVAHWAYAIANKSHLRVNYSLLRMSVASAGTGETLRPSRCDRRAVATANASHSRSIYAVTRRHGNSKGILLPAIRPEFRHPRKLGNAVVIAACLRASRRSHSPSRRPCSKRRRCEPPPSIFPPSRCRRRWRRSVASPACKSLSIRRR